MKKYSAILALTVLTALASVNVNASSSRERCRSGLIPKFEDNKVTYVVEPFIWNDFRMRRQVINAFEAWNSATGSKLQFKYVSGDRGYTGDKIFQVRFNWIPLFGLAHSGSLPNHDPGQCLWYDNDIVLNREYLDRFNKGNQIFKTMMHEIGHAVGIRHTEGMSVVHVNEGRSGTSARYRGLFGYDIQFVRNLYGMHAENLKINFRADPVKLVDGKLTSVEEDISPVIGVNRISSPYTVTNMSGINQRISIEMIAAEALPGSNGWGPIKVVDSFHIYLGSGETESGDRELTLADMSGELFIGFRIATPDENRWDGAVWTRRGVSLN